MFCKLSVLLTLKDKEDNNNHHNANNRNKICLSILPQGINLIDSNLRHLVLCLFLCQNDLIIEMPRQRKKVTRYGKQDEAVRISDLETSGSDADYDEAGTPLSSQRGGRRKKRGGRHGRDNDDGSAMTSSVAGGLGEGYSRSDCFNVEKMLLIFG